jgi:hypothetical protein
VDSYDAPDIDDEEDMYDRQEVSGLEDVIEWRGGGCVCLCVCVCVCMYVCMCVCFCVRVCVVNASTQQIQNSHSPSAFLSLHNFLPVFTLPLSQLIHNLNFFTPLISSLQAQRQEFLKNKRSFIPNKMSDTNSQFGQKVGQSIYNPINEENKIEISECSTNNEDDSEDNEGVKSQYKGNEVSLLHSLTSMAFKAVNISTYTKNNISNNNSNNNANNSINDDDNEDDDSNNDDNNVNNDNNYTVNKTNNNSKANLIINNKLPLSQNRNNGNNGNESNSGIHIQVPHLIPSSGPGSALSHSLSKHNTPRDFLGTI